MKSGKRLSRRLELVLQAPRLRNQSRQKQQGLQAGFSPSETGGRTWRCHGCASPGHSNIGLVPFSPFQVCRAGASSSFTLWGLRQPQPSPEPTLSTRYGVSWSFTLVLSVAAVSSSPVFLLHPNQYVRVSSMVFLSSLEVLFGSFYNFSYLFSTCLHFPLLPWTHRFIITVCTFFTNSIICIISRSISVVWVFSLEIIFAYFLEWCLVISDVRLY